MIRETLDNLNDSKMADSKNCSVCRDLLANLGRFFDMLETARRSFTSNWLTVDEIATELKISKSIVYRLIRNGELEAVDLVASERTSGAHWRSWWSGRINGAQIRKQKSKQGRSP